MPDPRIAICMATYEPRPEHLRRQIQSIRAQSRADWVCVISDDASSAAARAEIERAIAGDPRFTVTAVPRRLGFYRNFERALRLAPPGVELIALADQDDVWDADKLEVLAAALDENPAAPLAYSDLRIDFDDGTRFSDTFWYLRRNEYRSMASLLIANTVTGAASMFRRGLLERALPFPVAPGEPYHDHWLALCALAEGEIAYVDRPTYTHVRHEGAVTRRAQQPWARDLRSRRELRRARLRARLRSIAGARGRPSPGWGHVYRHRYLTLAAFARTLLERFGPRLAPAHRRDLERLLAADRGLRGKAWLLLRALRPYFGRDETLAQERRLLGAVVWHRIAGSRAHEPD